MSSKVVPFGKYKGQPVEAMMADRGYCEWLAGQDWFRSRYAEIHTVIINYGSEPQDTPEHNRLQAMFLNPEFCCRVAEQADPRLVEFTRATANDWLLTNMAGRKYYLGEWKDWVVRPAVFESGGWDVIYTVENGAECRYEVDAYSDRFISFGGAREVHVEIKPSIGDDFPAVLRQVLSHRRSYCSHERLCVLLVDSFCGEGATLLQVREIFARSGIRLVMLADVYP